MVIAHGYSSCLQLMVLAHGNIMCNGALSLDIRGQTAPIPEPNRSQILFHPVLFQLVPVDRNTANPKESFT